MPLYFFNIDARVPTEDELGGVYASLEEAEAAAEIQLQRLLRYRHEIYAIIIKDHEHREVRRVTATKTG